MLKINNSSFTIIALLAVVLVSCSRNRAMKNKSSNIAFIANNPGKVILNYRKIKGKVPETFSEAMDIYNGTLPNRGDLTGSSLAYYKVTDNEFFFISYGANRVNEDGAGDDLILAYVGGVFVEKGVDYIAAAEKRKFDLLDKKKEDQVKD